MQEYPLVYRWKNNPTRAAHYGKRCRIVSEGTMGTVLVEFENGERFTTAHWSVKRVEKDTFPKQQPPMHGCAYCPGKLKYMPGALLQVPCEDCGGKHNVCRGCKSAPLAFRGVVPDQKLVLKSCPL